MVIGRKVKKVNLRILNEAVEQVDSFRCLRCTISILYSQRQRFRHVSFGTNPVNEPVQLGMVPPKYTSREQSANHSRQSYRPHTAAKARYSHFAFLGLQKEMAQNHLQRCPFPALFSTSPGTGSGNDPPRRSLILCTPFICYCCPSLTDGLSGFRESDALGGPPCLNPDKARSHPRRVPDGSNKAGIQKTMVLPLLVGTGVTAATLLQMGEECSMNLTERTGGKK
ncbi:hypothetical protein ANN_06684 [Periplaneta americana]|uniref:Uncharacterized protein n=1 Tax=Periplaneta americana TaxID=6978 RepID=A0ABQ8TGL9_PERAM|nr:hypothetical protein ANN_06684 [Periplaneta americana]